MDLHPAVAAAAPLPPPIRPSTAPDGNLMLDQLLDDAGRGWLAIDRLRELIKRSRQPRLDPAAAAALLRWQRSPAAGAAISAGEFQRRFFLGSNCAYPVRQLAAQGLLDVRSGSDRRVVLLAMTPAAASWCREMAQPEAAEAEPGPLPIAFGRAFSAAALPL
jgi:hypothetical protein